MSKLKAQLKKGGNKIFPNPNLIGIDTSNVLATITSSDASSSPISYTAQEDCICYLGNGRTDLSYASINNIYLYHIYGNGIDGYAEFFLLKKGDTLYRNSSARWSLILRVFGLKY